MDELLNDFSLNCEQNQPNQHRLMYETVRDAMIQVLAEVNDELIPIKQQNTR